MGSGDGTTSGARGLVCRSLSRSAAEFPNLSPAEFDTSGLEAREARLAVAIHRTVMQRWLTIEYLLNRVLSQPMHALEPAMRAVLLSGGAQLLFMDRIPAHAAVDESVELAGAMVRPGARGMVNAVLRKLAGLVKERVERGGWELGADRLPVGDGVVVVREACLPEPGRLAEHLAAATSHPVLLVERWVKAYGTARATGICRHGVEAPPVIVAVEESFEWGREGGEGKLWERHERGGFVVWEGSRDELVCFLGGDEARRVQDPGSAGPVRATEGLEAGLIVDCCAGGGTKTRQAAGMHRGAEVIASDVDAERVGMLREAFAGRARVKVAAFGRVGEALAGRRADLLMLDVPCSNTAVLGRRPEARYRFSGKALQSLVKLQREIARGAIQWLRPGGYLLYSTCSLEAQENQAQAAWMVRELGLELVREELVLPAGRGLGYHDGSYHALLRFIDQSPESRV